MQPNASERAGRDAVIQCVRKHAERTLKYPCVEVFGSERTGLALATSDIDFRIFPQENELEESTDKMKAPPFKIRRIMTARLRNLLPALQSSGDFMLCSLRHARYPLLSLQHRQSGIDLQIVAANDTQLSINTMIKYLEMYPGLREVYSVIKIMLDIRGLTDVYRGGLGSYSVFNMVLAAFRLSSSPSKDLARQLMFCLSFWATFDTYKHGISIEPAEIFPKGTREVISAHAKAKLLEKVSRHTS
jgi:non-canonical poly(A) RNA polymerase PAPD5/7